MIYDLCKSPTTLKLFKHTEIITFKLRLLFECVFEYQAELHWGKYQAGLHRVKYQAELHWVMHKMSAMSKTSN